jgi:hypothetical protein
MVHVAEVQAAPLDVEAVLHDVELGEGLPVNQQQRGAPAHDGAGSL